MERPHVRTGAAQTSYTHYEPYMTTMKSVPLSAFGWPNPIRPPYKKPTTAGWLQGDLLEFPMEVFQHSSRHPVHNDRPIFVGYFGHHPELNHLRKVV